MADASIITINNTSINVKDSTARSNIGTLSTLTTDAKTSAVAAINEVDSHADSAATAASNAATAAGNAQTTATNAATAASNAASAASTAQTTANNNKVRKATFNFTTSGKTAAINVTKSGYTPIGCDLPAGYAYPSWCFSGNYLYVYYAPAGSEVTGTATVYYVMTSTIQNI